MTEVNFTDLDKRYPPEDYNWVIVTTPDHPNETSEPIWAQDVAQWIDDPAVPMPTIRLLHILAAESDDVRGRLKELGYASEFFRDEEDQA